MWMLVRVEKTVILLSKKQFRETHNQLLLLKVEFLQHYMSYLKIFISLVIQNLKELSPKLLRLWCINFVDEKKVPKNKTVEVE